MERAALAALLAGAALACKGAPPPPAPAPPASAADAAARVRAALAAGDWGAVYDRLDQDSRWSVMSIHRAEREMHRLASQHYPAGPRERETARYAAAGAAAEPRDWFARAGREIAPRDAIERAAADPASFVRDPEGGWALASLRDALERRKAHASSAIELVQDNARRYSGGL